MTSEEFYVLLDEYEWESEVDRRDSQCVDRDWWAYREALQRNGVLIRFLCGRRFHLRLDSLIGQRFEKTPIFLVSF